MGFDYLHYVPILKGKQGELNAIQHTEPKNRKRFTPLIEVPPIPPEWPEGENDPVPAKTIDKHIKSVGKAFAKALKEVPSVFIDGYYIELEDELEDSSSPVDALFAELRSANIS